MFSSSFGNCGSNAQTCVELSNETDKTNQYSETGQSSETRVRSDCKNWSLINCTLPGQKLRQNRDFNLDRNCGRFLEET